MAKIVLLLSIRVYIDYFSYNFFVYFNDKV